MRLEFKAERSLEGMHRPVQPPQILFHCGARMLICQHLLDFLSVLQRSRPPSLNWAESKTFTLLKDPRFNEDLSVAPCWQAAAQVLSDLDSFSIFEKSPKNAAGQGRPDVCQTHWR